MNTTHHPAIPTPNSPAEMPEELMTIIPVMKARGCKSRTTIWNEIKDGSFPPPDMTRKRIRYWRASTVRKWQNVVIGPPTHKNPYQKIEKRRRRSSTDGPAQKPMTGTATHRSQTRRY